MIGANVRETANFVISVCIVWRLCQSFHMKSAYELAMERLEKTAPTVKLNERQRSEIAEIDSTFRARIAEREIFLKEQIEKAIRSQQFGEIEALEKQLASEIRRLNDECEAKKEKVRTR